jgi:hypothetical protein
MTEAIDQRKYYNDSLLHDNNLDSTGWPKIICAPDDYSTKKRRNILNSFNHLPWYRS